MSAEFKTILSSPLGSSSVCQGPEVAPSLRLDSLSPSCKAEQPSTLLLLASVQGAPKEVVDPSSGRATLLESIHQAGGIGKAKLRSVKERKLEKKKQKEQEQGEDRGCCSSQAPSWLP